jgi:hypothetical protein
MSALSAFDAVKFRLIVARQRSSTALLYDTTIKILGPDYDMDSADFPNPITLPTTY